MKRPDRASFQKVVNKLHSRKQLSDYYGVKRETIALWAKEYNIYIPYSRLGRPTENEKRDNQIYNMFLYGATVDEILRNYGLSPDRIFRIITNKIKEYKKERRQQPSLLGTIQPFSNNELDYGYNRIFVYRYEDVKKEL